MRVMPCTKHTIDGLMYCQFSWVSAGIWRYLHLGMASSELPLLRSYVTSNEFSQRLGLILAHVLVRRNNRTI